MRLKGIKLKKTSKTRNTMSENRLGHQQIEYSLQDEIDVLQDEMIKKEE